MSAYVSTDPPGFIKEPADMQRVRDGLGLANSKRPLGKNGRPIKTERGIGSRDGPRRCHKRCNGEATRAPIEDDQPQGTSPLTTGLKGGENRQKYRATS